MSAHAAPQAWRFAIDRGGTFTDIVAVDPAGRLHTLKLLSHDARLAGDPAVRGIEALLAAHGGHGQARIASVRLGTTVATNALLERKGAPTLLVTTRGFGDALRIGYQNRPEIFARAIRLPPPLYTGVIEADERVDVDGRVLVTLDEPRLREDLAAARGRGLTSVAIVFMHGFRHPAHERRAVAVAREAGFEEVIASHTAAALLGLVARGDTAVADAYLSPVLLRYVRGFHAEIAGRFPDARVEFMQSSGGLVDADGFRGINGVLSGPAGGVVGMIDAGTDGRRERIIGLDMGGTSTDCSLYAGELPRRYLTEIDGVRLQAPMMDIHTIAAGGGSIVRYADGRLQAGPDSAGADPGPACYRRGGPATITDCNLVLGRLQPSFFPRVFGPRGDESLDVDASRRRLAAIAETVAAETGRPGSMEELAAGFLGVAVARMSFAVRELALRQGHDPASFSLLCFGGAAGQHACAVADALGCREVLLPALAGVLSAWGIGRAEPRCIRRRSVEAALAHWPRADAEAAFDALTRLANAELVRQGVEPAAIALRHTAQLRLAGSDSALEVRWGPRDQMHSDFAAAYRRTYGFLEETQSLIVAAISVEAASRPTHSATQVAAPRPISQGVPLAVPAWVEGRWQAVPLYRRSSLDAGARLAGPALVAEDGATSWIAPGWSGSIAGDGNLVLARGEPAGAVHADPATPDPTRLEVMNGLFMHVAEQMGVVLQQTASSVNIKERLDFSCAIFDADAQLVANAPHMPVHLGSMGASVAAVIAAHGADLRPDDAYLVNSPYDGGTHLPDMTVVTPVFDATGSRIRYFTASRAHHADVGGLTPGSMPPGSRRIDDEGVLVPATRIVRGGRLDEALLGRLLAGGAYPARNPAQNLADLRAQLAANARGIRELARAAAELGLDDLAADMRHVQDNAEDCARRAIRRLSDGAFRYELDNGQAIAVRIQVDRQRGCATVDFTGTSAQQHNNFNAPRAVTVAAVLYVFRTLVEEPIPLNAGCLRPITIIVPAGCMLDPGWPAAVVAGNVETSQCIVDALYGALGLQAASQGTMNNLTFGNERYQYYETIGGGAGAGPGYDGASGVQTHMTNSRLTDPEVLESRFPVLLRRFAIRARTGGAGVHRGGDGLIRSIEFREPMTAAILSNHRRVAPFGAGGGSAGAVGVNRLFRGDGGSRLLPATAEIAVEAGDVISIETPGGGGFGNPQHERS